MTTRLLIVDDSALMRRHLSGIFEAEGDFEIRHARNGKEAIDLNQSFAPDVVTLDINMPELDGLSALTEMMMDRPVPVVMVSSLTEEGALATFEALNLGAVDYVAKPGGTISLSLDAVRGELVHKVRGAVRSKPPPRKAKGLVERIRQVKAPPPRRVPSSTGGIVIIGVSTGGPRTLEEVLAPLPATFPWPIVVAQHMPASFTRPFAERLDSVCALTVEEVSRPTQIAVGHVYVAKGGADLILSRRAGAPHAVPRPESRELLWHPSVELLGRTVAEVYDPTQVIGVMLTGMGNDGAESFAALHRRGARTIAESEATAVVYGMPKELAARGGATTVLPADRIANQLERWTQEGGSSAVGAQKSARR
jgi:two-component system, chemotaxis family, protein-glutamate methylesterase/glutaminase